MIEGFLMSAALAPVRSQGSVQQFSQDTVQRLAKELAGNGAPPTGAQRARRYGGAALVLLDRFLGRVHHNAGDLVPRPWPGRSYLRSAFSRYRSPCRLRLLRRPSSRPWLRKNVRRCDAKGPRCASGSPISAKTGRVNFRLGRSRRQSNDPADKRSRFARPRQ